MLDKTLHCFRVSVFNPTDSLVQSIIYSITVNLLFVHSFALHSMILWKSLSWIYCKINHPNNKADNKLAFRSMTFFGSLVKFMSLSVLIQTSRKSHKTCTKTFFRHSRKAKTSCDYYTDLLLPLNLLANSWLLRWLWGTNIFLELIFIF